jgi:hypothetical protein
VLTSAARVWPRAPLASARPRRGALALKAIGFWLDRFELVFSPRGIVFGAAYTDIYASLPVLGALAVFAALCAVACLARSRGRACVWWRAADRARSRLGGGARCLPGAAPALQGHAQRARGRAAVHRPQHPDDPPGVRAGPDRRARVPCRRSARRARPRSQCGDHQEHQALGLPAAAPHVRQLQEIRTYYKFVDVDNDRYIVNGEYRQLMLSPRELSYQHCNRESGSTSI